MAPPSASWHVLADENAAVPDAVLKSGVQYTLRANEAQIVFSPMGGCFCGVKPYIIPMEAVEKIEMITPEFSQPGMILTVTMNDVPVFHKLWVKGGEEAISGCCDWVNAARRLIQGLVVVAGCVDPKMKPSPQSITYFAPEIAAKLFEVRQKLVNAAVGTTEEVKLLDDTVTMVVEKYGITILTGGSEGSEEEEPKEPCSVFIKEVNTMTYSLHVEQQSVMLPGAEEETKAWRVMTRFAGSAESESPGNLTAVLSPTTILRAPYLAGLGRGATRPRSSSRVSLRIPSVPLSRPAMPTMPSMPTIGSKGGKKEPKEDKEAKAAKPKSKGLPWKKSKEEIKEPSADDIMTEEMSAPIPAAA